VKKLAGCRMGTGNKGITIGPSFDAALTSTLQVNRWAICQYTGSLVMVMIPRLEHHPVFLWMRSRKKWVALEGASRALASCITTPRKLEWSETFVSGEAGDTFCEHSMQNETRGDI
jgi:hypothetical protein